MPKRMGVAGPTGRRRPREPTDDSRCLLALATGARLTRLDERLGAFAKVDASDTVGHGGMIVHRFEDREAEDLVANHPGVTTGPFEGVTIGRCRKGLLEHERPI